MSLPIAAFVLYKHGVGYFEREGRVEGDADAVADLQAGRGQRRAQVADRARPGRRPCRVGVLRFDQAARATAGRGRAVASPTRTAWSACCRRSRGRASRCIPASADRSKASSSASTPPNARPATASSQSCCCRMLTDQGDVRSFDLHAPGQLCRSSTPPCAAISTTTCETQLSAKKKDARTFTFFAQGEGQRTIRLSYTLEAPVWKATYRILLGEEEQPPLIQGWAVVDNTQDEDWEDVQLSLVAGLPVSFVHDLYTPRYIRRPVVAGAGDDGRAAAGGGGGDGADAMLALEKIARCQLAAAPTEAAMANAAHGQRPRVSSCRQHVMASRQFHARPGPRAQARRSVRVRDRASRHHPPQPVRAGAHRAARRSRAGRCCCYNRQTRAENPMRCVEFKNTTGLTLEGGPVTVLEARQLRRRGDARNAQARRGAAGPLRRRA